MMVEDDVEVNENCKIRYFIEKRKAKRNRKQQLEQRGENDDEENRISDSAHRLAKLEQKRRCIYEQYIDCEKRKAIESDKYLSSIISPIETKGQLESLSAKLILYLQASEETESEMSITSTKNDNSIDDIDLSFLKDIQTLVNAEEPKLKPIKNKREDNGYRIDEETIDEALTTNSTMSSGSSSIDFNLPGPGNELDNSTASPNRELNVDKTLFGAITSESVNSFLNSPTHPQRTSPDPSVEKEVFDLQEGLRKEMAAETELNRAFEQLKMSMVIGRSSKEGDEPDNEDLVLEKKRIFMPHWMSIKDQSEADKNDSSSPHSSRTSSFSLETWSPKQVSISQRVQADPSNKKKRNDLTKVEAEVKEGSPISPEGKSIATISPTQTRKKTPHNSSDFISRQQVYQEAKQMKLEKMRQELLTNRVEIEGTYKPRINNASKALTRNLDTLFSWQSEINERKKMQQERIEEMKMKEYTFQPVVNQKPRSISAKKK